MLGANENSKMKIMKIIFCIIYICLTATSFLFVQKTIREHMAGKTDYHKSYLPTTMKDFPTLTICFKHKVILKYGIDFTIGLKYNYSWPDKQYSYVPLKSGENVITNSDGITHNLILDDLVVKQWYKWAHLHTKCIKVSRKPSKLDKDLLDMLLMKVDFISEAAPLKSTLYVTSEANAYGAVYEKWLDGRVQEYTLKNDSFHTINLRVEEIRRVQDLCQDQSYYECVASKFGLDKSYKRVKCLPYTLPTNVNLNGLEYCNDKNGEHHSNYEILDSIRHKKAFCRRGTPNTCLTKEYKLKDFFPPIKNERNPQNGYEFGIGFIGSTSSADRSTDIHKTVFTEYYIIDDYTLIGTVGGTLGLMIGFSFMSAITSLLELADRIKRKYSRKIHNSTIH